MSVIQTSQKGQILIPSKLRKKYGIKPGSIVQLLEEEDAIIIKPAHKDPIEAACGFLKGKYSLTSDLIKEHRKEKTREEKDCSR